MTILTVSQINRYIKSIFESDKKLADLYVRAEISNFTHHYRSGHFYFSLRDEHSAIRAVMFREHASELPFEPEDGMAVLVRAGAGVFERDGTYQLYVTDMQPDGAGALAVAFEQLKRRLAAEGLFDERRKKPLPAFPRRIGVVTSRGAAALQDIINVVSRRYPLAALIVSPAQVQGAGAAASVRTALELLDSGNRCDVIILARGGGSAEDLSAFNDEALCRAVSAARTPTVSAVGHETDYSICDFVADLRAPTPSAAAELVTPSAESVRQRMELYRRIINPQEAISQRLARLDSLRRTIRAKMLACIQASGQTAAARAAMLENLSPLAVLARGYAIVEKAGRAVKSSGELAAGDRVCLRLLRGVAEATITGTEGTDWLNK